MLLAEAGLSECARDAACSADFNRPFYIAGLVVLAGVWLFTCVLATVLARRPRLTATSRRRWIAVIWLLPFVGSAVFFCVDAAKRVARMARSDVSAP